MAYNGETRRLFVGLDNGTISVSNYHDTVQPHYMMPHYNVVFNLTLPKCSLGPVVNIIILQI